VFACVSVTGRHSIRGGVRTSHAWVHVTAGAYLARSNAGRRGRELLQMSASVHDWVSVLHRWLAQLPSPLVPWHDGGGGGGESFPRVD
jgi:hypothetical protein